MGITATGLRYPEPTEPVAQGATNIANLAADVTDKYLIEPYLGADPARTFAPSSGTIPAGASLRIVGGQLNLMTDAAGQGVLYTGLSAGILALSVMSTVPPSTPEDLTFSAAVRSGNTSAYVYVMKGGVKVGARAVGITWIAIGW
jgi:hypothetical protein